jgi:hypothetical protein
LEVRDATVTGLSLKPSYGLSTSKYKHFIHRHTCGTPQEFPALDGTVCIAGTAPAKAKCRLSARVAIPKRPFVLNSRLGIVTSACGVNFRTDADWRLPDRAGQQAESCWAARTDKMIIDFQTAGLVIAAVSLVFAALTYFQTVGASRALNKGNDAHTSNSVPDQHTLEFHFETGFRATFRKDPASNTSSKELVCDLRADAGRPDQAKLTSPSGVHCCESLPGRECDGSQVPGVCSGSHRATKARRRRSAKQYAVAEQGGRAGKGPRRRLIAFKRCE